MQAATDDDEVDSGTLDIEDALLLNAPYPYLRIEVDYVEGREPSAENLRTLVEDVKNVTKKRDVQLDPPELIAGVVPDPTRQWTLEEVHDLHNRTFQSDADPASTGRGEAAYIHILFLNGRVDKTTAGLQFANFLVILKDGLLPHEGYEAGITRNQELEVMLHEMGHAFGLVNCGVPMTYDREGDRCHSTRSESIMFAAGVRDSVEPSLDNVISRVTRGEWIYSWYDEYDLDDIATYQTRWDTTK